MTNQPLFGLVDAVCPYCETVLQDKPGRKKKCPYCRNFIYVRTRPSDKEKVLLREDQLLELEEQWSIANGTHKQFIATQLRLRDVSDQLRERFGREPSGNDVQWAILNDDTLTHIRYNNWGLYRNCRFSMSEILEKEGKHRERLIFLLEVCLLDINGPNNVGGIAGPAVLREFPRFDPKIGSLASGVVSRVTDAMASANLSLHETQACFANLAKPLCVRLGLPLSVEDAWRTLECELE